jgi:NarL family two-component system response regulator YdfI
LDEADILTPRQLEVLELLGQGYANKEIETELGVADRTVRAHLTEIFKVLGVQSRIRAVVEARRRGLIP